MLCLDEQKGFADFADTHAFQHAAAISHLDELLPFGKLRCDFAGGAPTFENWSTRYPNAEPLVAVTSSSELLAALCCASDKHTKIVVVNGLRVLSNPQAFDDIAACQRVVLFADHDNEERMKEFEARGCRFWVFGEREFFSDNAMAEALEPVALSEGSFMGPKSCPAANPTGALRKRTTERARPRP